MELTDVYPLVSVIVPAFNAQDYIETCLASLERQTWLNVEVIVIDDGSSDATAEIVNNFCLRDNRFAIVQKENGGVSSARNLGLHMADGQYVLFVDSDDWLENNAIERFVSEAETKGVDVVIAEYYEDDYSNKQSKYVRLDDFEDRPFPSLFADEDTGYGGFIWNKLFRRKAIKHKYHEELYYYENLVFLLENCNNKTKFSVIHDPLYHYRIHSDSAVHCIRFNPRQLSTFDALRIALNIVPEELVAFYKFRYINRLCRIKYIAKIEGAAVDFSQEELFSQSFLSDIVHSSDVSVKLKLKAIVICVFPSLYKVYMKHQKIVS